MPFHIILVYTVNVYVASPGPSPTHTFVLQYTIHCITYIRTLIRKNRGQRYIHYDDILTVLSSRRGSTVQSMYFWKLEVSIGIGEGKSPDAATVDRTESQWWSVMQWLDY